MKKSFTGVEADIKETRVMVQYTFGEAKKRNEDKLFHLEECRACPVLTDTIDCPPGCQSL